MSGSGNANREHFGVAWGRRRRDRPGGRPSSSRRPMPANASRGRSSSATTGGSRRRSSPRPCKPASRRPATTSFWLAPTATPTIGWLVRELTIAPAASRSRRRTTHPNTTGSSSSSPAAWCSADRRAGRLLDRWQRREFRWASWDGLGTIRPIDDPDAVAPGACARDSSTSRRSGAAGFKVVARRLSRGRRAAGGSLSCALGCETIVLGGQPDGRYDHPPEPTVANLHEFARVVPAVGAAVGFAQDPDADRLAIVDETGRYIGEELTLALAASRRLEQGAGRSSSTCRPRA